LDFGRNEALITIIRFLIITGRRIIENKVQILFLYIINGPVRYIKDIARYGLENDGKKLLEALNELIEHSKKTKN